MKKNPTEQTAKNELLREFFNAVVDEDVVTQDKAGRIFLGGELVSVAEADNLQKEAKMLERMKIWKLLTNTLIDQAHKVMFNNAETYDDMRNGKMMLYNIGVQKSIVERLKNLNPQKKG